MGYLFSIVATAPLKTKRHRAQYRIIEQKRSRNLSPDATGEKTAWAYVRACGDQDASQMDSQGAPQDFALGICVPITSEGTPPYSIPKIYLILLLPSHAHHAYFSTFIHLDSIKNASR